VVALAALAIAACGDQLEVGRSRTTSSVAEVSDLDASAQVPLLTLTQYLVDNLARRTYRGDFEYFNGRWASGSGACWMCSTGPGAAAAVLAGFPGPKASYYRNLAERTFTDAIRRRQRPDGSFVNQAVPEEGAEIPTIFFGVELGEAFQQLRSSLPAGTRRLWQEALGRAATFLVQRSGALNFYVNGNINLQVTELLFFAAHATGAGSLRTSYNESWSFLLHPGARFPGFGLHLTRPYTRPNGSDGSGYLAESGGGAPGFDADYTQLQADEAARLYVFSRDPRALLLLNLLANQLLGLRRDGWLLDTSHGTRHPESNRRIPLTTSAIAALAWFGGRADLTPDLPGQIRELRLTMCGGLTYSSVNLYRAMGDELSVILRAAQLAGPAERGEGLGSRPTCPNLPSGLRRRLIP
jgi:hypothetical protein